ACVKKNVMGKYKRQIEDAGRCFRASAEGDNIFIRLCSSYNFDDIFDLDALYDDYMAMCDAWDVDKSNIFDFRTLRGKRLSDFADIALGGEKLSDMSLVGLMIGVPIEITFSTMYSL